MTYHRRALALALAAVFTAGLFAMGCGEPTALDPTPVKTFKITPASGVQPSPTAAAVGTATAPPADGTPDAKTTLTIAGISSVFDKEELSAPAGPVRIEFDNRDAGVVHNLHLYKGKDAKGEDIAATELERGLLEQELNVTLEPGEYFYVCDAHPTTMKGVLTVS